MKRQIAAVVTVLVCCILLGACWNQQRQAASSSTEEATDTLAADSTFEDADTLLLDRETERTPLPSTVDEFFGDFIFNFDQSNRLQRNRIRFPFTIVEANGSKRTVEQHDWQHHYLFLQQDFCTVLWTSHRQMDMAEDTALTKACVEQIYLHSRQVNRFQFERDSISRQWFLTEERILPFEEVELSNFYDFYRKFTADSVYQRQHVSNHLRYITYDEENEYEPIKGNINADQWFEFQPEIPQSVLTNINYGQAYGKAARIIMQMRGINNGLQNLLTFQREGEHWRLTVFEN